MLNLDFVKILFYKKLTMVWVYFLVDTNVN